MKAILKRLLIGITFAILAVLVFLWPELTTRLNEATTVSAQVACTTLSDPKNLPSPVLINFDTLPNAAVIAASYQPSFGVTFEDSPVTKAIIYGNEPLLAKSSPNVAINNAAVGTTSANVPMLIKFDTPKTHVGFWIGNGSGQQLTALVQAFDANGILLCEARYPNVPEPHTTFAGLSTSSALISSITLDYGNTSISESIDDLYFSPPAGVLPTRTPVPTWTPIPTALPTLGPTPTATAVVPMIPYHPYTPIIKVVQFFLPDFAIHGIEITQAIQCFNPSQGLAGCPDNSLAVVNKKDSAARIYLKANNAFSVYPNVPVRLYIRANSVWYTANSSGKTTTTINQLLNDSANIWFNVNFNSSVVVDFYAVVDPDNIYTETNEANNRYPAVGYVTKTFQTRKSFNIVGQRLRYHPSGYGGAQYAGGWAVNGGAADWYEQVMPVRNNAINYSVKSGYLDWTTSLGGGDGQHALIQTLNAQWMLENLFAWWFSGPFTGARHVYGWAPSAGYSGGHADMPVYPHAGGLGIVGIGSDAAGTNTDNPGSGALIFGHELTHDYNVYHTNTADGCGSNDSNTNFPYASSSIQEVGYNPVTGKIYDPALTHDLMSYCPSGGSKQGWISPFTWTTMFGNFLASNSLASYDPRYAPPMTLYRTAASESLQVNAAIFNPVYKPPLPGKLGKLYKSQGVIPFNLLPGPYSVELRDGGGGVLSSQSFTVNFESEYAPQSGAGVPISGPTSAPPFPPTPTSEEDVSFIMDWVPGTASIALMNGATQLDQVFVSPNAPQVLITSPSGAESWLAGSTHALTWDGSDLDGNPLSYSVFYSSDGGATWDLLAGELSGSSLDIATDSMAGGSDVRFRVVVTDGVNTSQDETDQAISIPNKLPVATVLSPLLNEDYLPGGLVVLQGMGQDLEDGTLPDESLLWSSDKQGSLGTGPSVGLNTLSPGWHTITLRVIDSHGAFSTASVQIFIGNRVFVPVVGK